MKALASSSSSNSKYRRNQSWLVVLPLSALFVSIYLIMLTGGSNTAQAQVQAVTPAGPTPTPPSLERPNLHLYFSRYFEGGSSQPWAGLRLKFYSYQLDTTTQKYNLGLKYEGISDGHGQVAFDAAALPHGLYYLETREADNTLVLPTDPALPVPGTGGLADPQVMQLTPLDLYQGAVVYVYQLQIRSLLNPGLNSGGEQAHNAIYVPATQKYIYYPNASTQFGRETPANPVAAISPSPANGSNPAQPQTTSGSPAGQGQGQSSPAPSSGSGAGNWVQPGLGSYPTTTPGGPSGATSGTVQAVTSTPAATPTVECRYCIAPSQAASATAEAATIRAQLTAGNYTPKAADAGRSGEGVPSASASASKALTASPGANSASASPGAKTTGQVEAAAPDAAANNGSGGNGKAGGVTPGAAGGSNSLSVNSSDKVASTSGASSAGSDLGMMVALVLGLSIVGIAAGYAAFRFNNKI